MEQASRSSGKRKAAADFDAFAHGGGGGKRRMEAAAPEKPDWTSLHQDITRLIAERLLDEDVAEYMIFRAVCTHWRSSTPSPRDPTLAEHRFHPRGYVALGDGTGVRPVDEEAITFFHTSSGRVRRMHLPELRGKRIVGFTDGLIILLDTGTAVVSVLHPFTRVIVRLPDLSRFFHLILSKQSWFKMNSFVWLNAAVCAASPSSIAVVIHFVDMPVVICAEPSSKTWKIIQTNIQFSNTLPFNGWLYGMTRVGRQLVLVYPVLYNHIDPVVAEVPKDLGHPRDCRYYLVDSMGAMLLAVLHKVSSVKFNAFALFKVDLRCRKLIQVPSLGDRALFLSDDRCLSVSAKSQPSISSNCIYFGMPGTLNPAMLHSLSDATFGNLSMPREHEKLAVTSVQPYTLADHLLTYCHHREWARGFMFHEFYSIPKYCDRLRKKTIEQDSEVVVPRLQGTVDELKKQEIPDLFIFMIRWHGNTKNIRTLTE